MNWKVRVETPTFAWLEDSFDIVDVRRAAKTGIFELPFLDIFISSFIFLKLCFSCWYAISDKEKSVFQSFNFYAFDLLFMIIVFAQTSQKSNTRFPLTTFIHLTKKVNLMTLKHLACLVCCIFLWWFHLLEHNPCMFLWVFAYV